MATAPGAGPVPGVIGPAQDVEPGGLHGGHDEDYDEMTAPQVVARPGYDKVDLDEVERYERSHRDGRPFWLRSRTSAPGAHGPKGAPDPAA